MQSLVEALCSDACAGRATGTPGGLRARALVTDALRTAGVDPVEQPLNNGGANLIATLPGDDDRYVLIAAHYDHLGQQGRTIYRGADDNAAAVAILVEVARAVAATRPAGRGVIIAAFDAEEPPHFMSSAMGSQHFVRHPTVPLSSIDMMICMDLVGHFIGPAEAPAALRDSLFVLGAERSHGTAPLVDATAVPGLISRRIDADVIPPLSDYLPFWQAEVPFLFLTGGRWRHYHTPEDTPDKLSYPKIAATASWLDHLVRALCSRDDDARFENHRDDASTLQSTIDLLDAVLSLSPEAALGKQMATELLRACDPTGRLPEARQPEAQALVAMLETRFA